MNIANPKKSILRENPYRNRRSFIAHMNPLSPIGDIASATLSEGGTTTETITWQTATDWDNAVDEAGVVHEIFGDLTDDTTVQLGYPSYDWSGSGLQSYWPSHDGSGSITDVTGGLNGTAVGSPTYDTSAFLGGSSIGYNNSEYFDVGDQTALEGTNFTLLTWLRPTANMQTSQGGLGKWQRNVSGQDGQYLIRTESYDASWHADFNDGGIISVNGPSNDVDADTWQMLTATWDGSTFRLYKNTTEIGSASTGSSMIDDPSPFWIGRYDSSYWDGEIGPVRFYTRALSSSEVSERFNSITAGHLTTATKSFSSPKSPDLQNLSYSLNGESITIDVIGSPGTASEEVVTQSLGGSTSYTLSWSSSHTDFRLRIEPSTSVYTATPTFGAGELVG